MNYVFIHVSRSEENVWAVSLLGRIVLEVTEVGHGLAGLVNFWLQHMHTRALYHIATACVCPFMLKQGRLQFLVSKELLMNPGLITNLACRLAPLVYHEPCAAS